MSWYFSSPWYELHHNSSLHSKSELGSLMPGLTSNSPQHSWVVQVPGVLGSQLGWSSGKEFHLYFWVFLQWKPPFLRIYTFLGPRRSLRDCRARTGLCLIQEAADPFDVHPTAYPHRQHGILHCEQGGSTIFLRANTSLNLLTNLVLVGAFLPHLRPFHPFATAIVTYPVFHIMFCGRRSHSRFNQHSRGGIHH